MIFIKDLLNGLKGKPRLSELKNLIDNERGGYWLRWDVHCWVYGEHELNIKTGFTHSDLSMGIRGMDQKDRKSFDKCVANFANEHDLHHELCTEDNCIIVYTLMYKDKIKDVLQERLTKRAERFAQPDNRLKVLIDDLCEILNKDHKRAGDRTFYVHRIAGLKKEECKIEATILFKEYTISDSERSKLARQIEDYSIKHQIVCRCEYNSPSCFWYKFERTAPVVL